MGCFLLQKGIEFVDNFVAQTTKSVHNINRCLGVSWVDDNVYVSGSDSSGIINILDSNGQNIGSISSIGKMYYIHHRDNNIYYTNYSNHVYCIANDGSHVFTFSSLDLK
jgi:DNA-binding beta-propeller fold protein YncE